MISSAPDDDASFLPRLLRSRDFSFPYSISFPSLSEIWFSCPVIGTVFSPFFRFSLASSGSSFLPKVNNSTFSFPRTARVVFFFFPPLSGGRSPSCTPPFFEVLEFLVLLLVTGCPFFLCVNFHIVPSKSSLRKEGELSPFIRKSHIMFLRPLRLSSFLRSKNFSRLD